MHLNIKNDEAHELATELARLTGESLTAVVTSALRERLERETHRLSRQERFERVMELARQSSALPDANWISAEDAIGYDENGLPI